MHEKVVQLIDKWKQYYSENAIECRNGDDADANQMLAQLGIQDDSGLSILFKQLAGPFTSTGERRLPDLLDIVSGSRTVKAFSDEFQNRYAVAATMLAISQIEMMTGLFYETTTGAVYEVELDLEFDQFLGGGLPPTWKSSAEFVIDYLTNVPS